MKTEQVWPGAGAANDLEGGWDPAGDALDDAASLEPAQDPVSGVCPHCLAINFSDAEVCRECHGELRPHAVEVEPAADAGSAEPEPDAPWPAPGPSWRETGAPSAAVLSCEACGAQDVASASFCRECGAAFTPGAGRASGVGWRTGATLFGFALGALVVTGLLVLRGPPTAERTLRPAPSARLTISPDMPKSPPVLRPPVPTAPVAASPRPVAASPTPVAAPGRTAQLRVTGASPASIAHRAKGTAAPAPPKAPARRAGLPPARIYDPIWVSRPSRDDVRRRYPARAQKAGVEGAATMDCVIDRDGGLRQCAVVSEAPARQGFGQAALALSSSFRAGPTTPSGWPTAGYRVRVPVEWREPQAPLF
jgi:protein TonB